MSTNQNRLKTIFIVVTAVLLGVIGFLLINSSQKSNQIDQQSVQLDEVEKLQLDLEKQYYEALSELEQQRGTNDELNSMIEAQKSELKQQKDQISQLIVSRNELGRAREQMKQMKANSDKYMTEIEDLKAKNEELFAQNENLTTQNSQLSQDIEKERIEKDEIASARAALMSDKEKLEMNNKDLSKKVSKASMVPVFKIKVDPLEIKKSGKEGKVSKAENTDRLRVCFSTGENKLTEPGYERFYVRIISPTGETLAVESMGSGNFNSTENNEQIRYTQIKEIEYNNDAVEACLNWDKENAFTKGDYKVEVYNKGYLAGATTFKLK
ncbi:MAG: hypothetical protein IPI60_00435 [Saprospiraceae bacterium]|jgi:hypothetical protein|nr:hypothetical protein [Saprospiraceae bacterium]